ncbi:DNA cytosine methyltransferase [Cellulomonas composti]|uniref:DNA (cytosine-5-)-methyltransferase n=1 Tax=Cellulomonas composti TaxID=266130 RepID=A0A511JEB8_9CELL|nr:DNA cytosine methyltransferase [Cellulomonas composti]GEL96334.1 putative BsuMI modification methylase subunit YdiO [Cellulomonas composti]
MVDLFAGCGGLTLGVAEAAKANDFAVDVRLAVDFEAAAIRTFKANFPSAKTQVAAVETLFDGDLGSEFTAKELAVARSVGELDVLVGGPPCQGHSSLNNHTRREDPKNRFYLRMARAAEVLRPRVILIENVPAVVHDSEGVVGPATQALAAAGYTVADSTVELVRLGVPQKRRRHVLLGVRAELARDDVDVVAVLEAGTEMRRNLRWAIGDLETKASTAWVDTPSRPSATNAARMQWLIDNDAYDLPNHLRPVCHQGEHSYVSMYGRLNWKEPAQTITSGYGSMGQGRFVHPSLPRTLTPHEAARIQGFPDFFRFDSAVTRTELSVIIGNAVPPALTSTLMARLIAAGVWAELEHAPS